MWKYIKEIIKITKKVIKYCTKDKERRKRTKNITETIKASNEVVLKSSINENKYNVHKFQDKCNICKFRDECIRKYNDFSRCNDFIEGAAISDYTKWG